jgi:Glycerol-3-phosphate dehydrogenase
MFSNIKKYGLISGPSFAKDLCYEKNISVSFATLSDELSNLMVDTTKSSYFEMMPTKYIYQIEIAGGYKKYCCYLMRDG